MKDGIVLTAVIMIVVSAFVCGLFFGWLFTHTSVVNTEYQRGYSDGKAFVYEDMREDQQKKTITEIKAKSK